MSVTHKRGGLTWDEVEGIVRNEISKAEGYDQDELADNRLKALEYYYAKPRGDEVSGRSKVQSEDLADMVESVVSNLGPIFAGDTAVEFEPLDEQDEDAAAVESEFVDHAIMADNPGYVVMVEAIKDALVLRNAIIKCYVKETEHVAENEFMGLSGEELTALMLDRDEEHEIEITEQEETAPGVYRVKVKEITIERRIVLEAVAPENFLHASSWPSLSLDGVRFCAERMVLTRSDLVEMGISKKLVAELPTYDIDTKPSSRARRIHESKLGQLSGEEPSTQALELFECFLQVDKDGDGVAELYKMLVANNGRILRHELVEFRHYAVGTAIIRPHEFVGISLYDRLKNVQDIKTATLRQYVDNMGVQNNAGAVVVDGQVNPDDLGVSRPNRYIRAKRPDAYVPLPVNDVGPSAIGLLDYMDKVRGARGGASLDMQQAELQIAGDSAHGVERQLSSKEQMAAYYARNIAETLVRNLYMLVHRTMRTTLRGQLAMRSAGQWKQTDPAEWRERKKITVQVGLSKGDRMERRAALEGVLGQQMQALQAAPGVLTDQSRVYQALVDWCQAANLEGSERYWIDPKSEPAQEAAKANAEAAQQQTAEMAQMQERLLAIQVELDRYKHDTQLALDYFKEQVKVEVEEAKIVGQATTQLRSAASAASGKSDEAA